MAVFLNKPSDFTAKSSTRKEPLTLLPPSAFEAPKVLPRPERDVMLKKATDEIQALKHENQKLKYLLDGSISDSTAAKTSVGNRHTYSTDERWHADEVISKQAEELSKLRSKLLRQESDHQAMLENYEHRLEVAERTKEESVTALSDSLLRKGEEHYEEVSELKRQHEGEVSDLKSRLEHLSTELECSKGDLTAQVTDLMAELRSMKQQAMEKEDTFQQVLREKDSELASHAQQIHLLKRFITESEQQHQPEQVWIQQCETLANKIKILEAEKETLESSVQLMNIRLNSLKEIQLVHDSELYKSNEVERDKNKGKELLLTRWRHKVYTLLIQQKSADLLIQKNEQNWKEKIEVLEEKLSSAQNTINILQHTVAEREADLRLTENRNRVRQQIQQAQQDYSERKVERGLQPTEKSIHLGVEPDQMDQTADPGSVHNIDEGLQQQMGQADQVALRLEDRVNRDASAVQQLADLAHRCEAQFQQQSSVLQQAVGQLKVLSQRVSFASGRMDVLKSQLTRKEALKCLEEDGQRHQPSEAVTDGESEEDWRIARNHMKEELLRVSGERDMLAAQLEQDSQTWTDKISSIRTQYDSEVGNLKRMLEELELSLQEKTQMCEQVRQRLQEMQSELEEARDSRDRLGTQLAHHQHTMQTALEEQRRSVEQEFTQHLADMEGKLNDARREHTKAVVTLRQRERQWNREQERLEEMKNATEAHYQAQITVLHQNLQGLEKERNLFMATLRQEGLLGKLRSERKEPMTLELQEEEEEEEGHPQDSHSATTLVTETDSLQAVQDSSEPVSAVLEDLKSLVPAVLEDSLDSSEESPTED